MKLIPQLALLLAIVTAPHAHASDIVIMHTNDTHSQIDPTPAGKGGIARRKALIDSIRAAEPHTLLIDAGDAVQGTVYFNLYGGKVEAEAMNALGYDYATLGNHEFDLGVDSLATHLGRINARYISTNYDLRGTPLDTLVSRYEIVQIAGKKIALIGINLNPDGIIDPNRSRGVKYLDAFKAAQATAWHLKHNDRVDYVIAITHIGYKYDDMPDDLKLVANTQGIDAIIGGHSHTVLTPGDPAALRYDLDNNPVVITQTGFTGTNLGVLRIDTETGNITSDLLTVDRRLDRRLDPQLEAMLAPYRHGVDSMKSIVVGKSRFTSDRKGEQLANLVADFVSARARELTGTAVDLAIINRGGIRNGIAKGNVTVGDVMEILPFSNTIEVISLSGADLLEALAINTRMQRVTFDRKVDVTLNGPDGDVVMALIDGKPVDPDRTYSIATIDYLTGGGDYMTPLKRGERIAASDRIMYEDLLQYINSIKRHTLDSSDKPRANVTY